MSHKNAVTQQDKATTVTTRKNTITKQHTVTKRSMSLWQKVIIGMILGIIAGYLIKIQEAANVSFFVEWQLLAKLRVVGTIYMNMLKMIVVPIVFFAILYGITSIDDVNTFGRLGLKAVLLYTISTIIAVCIGIGFGYIFEPGVGVHVAMRNDNIVSRTQPQSLLDILLNIIPTNPVQAMASGNTLQIVVFAFFVGFSLIVIGEKGAAARSTIISFSHAMFKMVELVIKTTPYGIFAVMAWVIGEYGVDVMVSLGKFVCVVIAAFMLQYILFGVMLIVVCVNPIPFYKKILLTQALAFATSSSKATLATAMSEMQNRMGVSKRVASFVLPLGAAINMSATAIYLGMAALFFAQMGNIPLDHSKYLIIVVASTIGSIGAAGFPGGGIIMMGMVLSSVGIPIDNIPLIMGIDRFLDMIRTAINITGDCVITIIIDKMEKSFNMKQYLDTTR